MLALEIILFIWQLPQIIVGSFVKLFSGAKYYHHFRESYVYSWNQNGLSLSKYFIFVPFDKDDDPYAPRVQQYIRHEYGHAIQSKYLGPIYLFVIGIPSLVWNVCFRKYREKKNKSYYDFYTEKWADELGGVIR